MVGVPNGTIEGGPVDRPGVVFSCPLRASGSGPCLAAEGNLYDNTPNTNLAEGGSSEEKQGQQMGFSMRSDGEQLVVCVCVVCGCVCVCGVSMCGVYVCVVTLDVLSMQACAPGWISVYQSTNYIQGRCLRVNKNFTEESYLEPCTQGECLSVCMCMYSDKAPDCAMLCHLLQTGEIHSIIQQLMMTRHKVLDSASLAYPWIS